MLFCRSFLNSLIFLCSVMINLPSCLLWPYFTANRLAKQGQRVLKQFKMEQTAFSDSLHRRWCEPSRGRPHDRLFGWNACRMSALGFGEYWRYKVLNSAVHSCCKTPFSVDYSMLIPISWQLRRWKYWILWNYDNTGISAFSYNRRPILKDKELFALMVSKFQKYWVVCLSVEVYSPPISLTGLLQRCAKDGE